MKRILSIWLFLLPLISFAQVHDEELAAEFLNNKEYEKATILYEKLLKKDPASPYYYQNLLTCYIETKNFDDAEKMIKKQSKRFPDNYFYKVDVGYLLELQEKIQEAGKWYNELIEGIGKNSAGSLQLATALLRRDHPELSVQTYRKARKNQNDSKIFAENLLDLYVLTGLTKDLIDESLAWINTSEQNVEKAKSYLYSAFSSTENVDYLKQKCLKYISSNPGNLIFDDLLIWVFVQNKDFGGAFRQSVAINRREKKDGDRLIELARICLLNLDFETAEKCFNHVVGLGETGGYYVEASYGLIDTKYRILTTGVNDSDRYVMETINSYHAFLDKFGKTSATSESIKQLADLYMFYKHDIQKAIGFLQDISSIPGVRARFIAETKLQLGDAYLVSGDKWEAQLLYSQVDKDFKEDPLGQEAKFRNARLSYFTSDFEWATEQLEILKTATSQLISNDAIELSLMIQENTGLDSNTDALSEFAKADLLIFQNKLDEAMEILNLFPFKFPKHALDDEILFAKARIMEKSRNLNEAIKFYEAIVKLYGNDLLADNALYNLARIYDFKLKDKQKAKETYERIIFDYNSSLFSVEARKRQKALKEELGS